MADWASEGFIASQTIEGDVLYTSLWERYWVNAFIAAWFGEVTGSGGGGGGISKSRIIGGV